MKKARKTMPEPAAPEQTITSEPPAWLSAYAAEVWIRTLEDLATDDRPLHQLNRQVFIGFCQAAADVREASEILAREGLTIQGGREGAKRHPAVSMRIAAMQALKSFADALGLTPASSSKLPPRPVPEEFNPFAEF